MKVSFGSKSGVQFDDKDPGQKMLHDERIRANTLLKEVIEGRIKRDAARQSYIFERNGWQKRLDEIPTGVVEGIGLFYYLAQVKFFNGLIEILDSIDLSHLDTKTTTKEGQGSGDDGYKKPAILKDPFLNIMKATNRSAWDKFNKGINKIIAYNEDKKRFNFMNSNKQDVAYFFKFIGYSQDWKLIANNILFKDEELTHDQLLKLSKPGPSAKWKKEILIPCGF